MGSPPSPWPLGWCWAQETTIAKLLGSQHRGTVMPQDLPCRFVRSAVPNEHRECDVHGRSLVGDVHQLFPQLVLRLGIFGKSVQGPSKSSRRSLVTRQHLTRQPSFLCSLGDHEGPLTKVVIWARTSSSDIFWSSRRSVAIFARTGCYQPWALL